MGPTETIAGTVAAHRRLEATLADLDDDAARVPSRLAGWTVGHLLTHLARNADSHVHLAEGILAGETRDQYPHGVEGRNADIADGAGRAAAELVADVAATDAATEQIWERMTEVHWADGTARGMAGPWDAVDLPFYRWREVEIHMVDLGLGVEISDLSPAYIPHELAWQARALTRRMVDGAGPMLRAVDLGIEVGTDEGGVVEGEGWQLVGWLFGRYHLAGAPELHPWP